MTKQLATEKTATVFSRNSETVAVVEEAFRAAGVYDARAFAENIDGALTRVESGLDSDFLVVDVGDDPEPFILFTALKEICSPSTQIVVVGGINDIRLYRSLRNAGAADYLVTPLLPELVSNRIRELSGTPVAPGPSQFGKIILILGVRGGVGATTIAVRLASLISQAPPRKVGLVDFDLNFSDLGVFLDLAPTSAMHDLLEKGERLDEMGIDRIMADVSPTLSVALTLDELGEGIPAQQKSISTTLRRLSSRYRYLLAEVPRWHLNDWPEVISDASAVILVSDGRISAARDVARWRAQLRKIGYKGTVLHVLNHSNAENALPLQEFNEVAGETPNLIMPVLLDIKRLSLTETYSHPGYRAADVFLAPLATLITGQRPERRTKISWLDRVKAVIS